MSDVSQAEAVRVLHTRIMQGWNARDGNAIAAAFHEDADLVGFDGTIVHGRAAIAAAQNDIFAHHETGRWVGQVQHVRMASPGVAVARAIAGWVQPGAGAPNSATNAIQFLVALHEGADWLLTLLQTTPAQFHGRPAEAAALAAELERLAHTP